MSFGNLSRGLQIGIRGSEALLAEEEDFFILGAVAALAFGLDTDPVRSDLICLRILDRSSAATADPTNTITEAAQSSEVKCILEKTIIFSLPRGALERKRIILTVGILPIFHAEGFILRNTFATEVASREI